MPGSYVCMQSLLHMHAIVVLLTPTPAALAHLDAHAHGVLDHWQRHEVHTLEERQTQVHVGHLEQADREAAEEGDLVDQRLQGDARLGLCEGHDIYVA